jgi:hypothetical protein
VTNPTGPESASGALVRLGEESWQEIVELRDGLMREVAGLDEKARGFRKIIEFLESALAKRNAPEADQRAALEGLLAAMRAVDAPSGSCSTDPDQILSRLLLGLMKVGREQ